MEKKIIEEMEQTIKNTLNSMQWYEINCYTIAKAYYKTLLHMHSTKTLHKRRAFKINEKISRQRLELEQIKTANKILFRIESAFAYYNNEDKFSKEIILEIVSEVIKGILEEAHYQ